MNKNHHEPKSKNKAHGEPPKRLYENQNPIYKKKLKNLKKVAKIIKKLYKQKKESL